MAEEQGRRRCVEIDRQMLVLRMIDVRALIDEDHPASVVWQITGELDPSEFYAPIRSLADGWHQTARVSEPAARHVR